MIALLAALLLFSQVAAAVNLCLMSGAGSHHAAAVDPCCDEDGEGSGADAQSAAGAPDDCCASLGMEQRQDGPPGAVGYQLSVQLPVLQLRTANWSLQPRQIVVAAPAPPAVGPPLNLRFKNFRI